MDYENLRLAYVSLSNKSCQDCGESINFHRLQLSPTGEEKEFVGEYECVCSADHDFHVIIYDREVYSEVILDDERRKSSTTAKSALRQEAEDIHPAMSTVDELLAAIRVLGVNWDRFSRTSDRLPGWAQRNLNIDLYDLEQNTDSQIILNFEKSVEVNEFYTDIHNYLSSAYTFTQVVEAVQSDLPVWNSELHEEYQTHRRNNKVIEGLRIFVQHEAILPVSFQLNTDESNERVADFIVELDEVLTLPSQVDRYPPDGYKKNADEYYSQIKGESINVSQNVAEFQQSALELTLSILMTFYDDRREKIEEYENYQHPKMGDMDLLSEIRKGSTDN